MTIPATDLFYNVEVSARATRTSPSWSSTTRHHVRGVQGRGRAHRRLPAAALRREAGDRVLLYMQNSPQFVLAYYGILRANAVVVPVNPMNMTDRAAPLRQGQPAPRGHRGAGPLPQMQPLLGKGRRGLHHGLVAAYSDYLKRPPT
jgi:fatty-acyl-CoA synthase